MGKLSAYLSAFCILVICATRWLPCFAGIDSCAQTPYPHVCNHFIGSSLLTNQQTEETFPSLFSRSISVTTSLAMQAHQASSSFAGRSTDPRANVAWSDCSELFADTVNLLAQSLATTNPGYAQTLLSAAVANQETCRNGFIDLNMASSFNQLSPSLMKNISNLLSNALAVKNGGKFPLSIQTNGRKLLSSDGFPSWVPTSHRRLLQSPPKADVVVAADGSGNYKTVSEAVAAYGGGASRYVIYVKAGVYKENVLINMKNIMLVGDGADSTIITGNNHAGEITTFRTATVAVTGDGFLAKGITFENTAGPENHQAVALRSSSDLSVFYNCNFKGYQDTLYVFSMRQYYRDCKIYGTVDFIFGDAAAVFQNCNIYLRQPMGGQVNTVTAHGRSDPNENTGIVIHASVIQGDSDLKSDTKSYLGRPWKEYSRTVIMKSTVDGAINSAGWLPWAGNFALSTLYYAEYMNTGSGADTSNRVSWPGYHVLKSPAEAADFTLGNFIVGDSWIPSTGVPFISGL